MIGRKSPFARDEDHAMGFKKRRQRRLYGEQFTPAGWPVLAGDLQFAVSN
jgi:hypothetical protein